MIRLLLVDDHEIIRYGLGLLFGAEPDIEVVGTAADGQEAVRVASKERPDVVLMDVSMPLLDGVEATRCIVASLPGTRIIMLSLYSDPSVMRQALDAGACGYLVKTASSAVVLDGIRAAHRGECAFGFGVGNGRVL